MALQEISPLQRWCSSVGIVGYGHLGGLLHNLVRRFTTLVSVKVYDPQCTPDGTTFVSLEEALGCDAVVLSVPMAAFDEVLRQVLGSPALQKHTVLVEVCTEKVNPGKLLRELAPGRLFVSTHPLWGPEAYRNSGGDVRGFPIVVTDHTLPQPLYNEAKAFVSSLGFRVEEMSAADHDIKIAAEELFTTHLLSQTLRLAGIIGGREASVVAPPSFLSLKQGTESVAGDTDLFLQLWKRVPACQDTFDRIYAAMTKLHDMKENGR